MKNKKKNIIIDKRISRFKYILSLSFLILLLAICYIDIVDKNYYSLKLEEYNNPVYYLNYAPRGRIYDRNHNLLVDNKLVPIIYYLKPSKITVEEEIELSYKLNDLIDIDCSKVTDKIIKDFYIAKNDTFFLITKDEISKYEGRKLSSDDLYNLKLERIDVESLNLSLEDKKAAYIFYLLNNGFSYDMKLIKKNLSDKELSIINDNLDDLDGIFVDYTYEREYLYKDTFKSILGNISSIPYEDKDYFLSLGYKLSDSVGSSYLEKQYEEYLKGEKGTYTIVNDKVVKLTESKRGKDLVLTIDIKLQKEIEKIIDEELIRSRSDPNTNLFNSVYVVIKDPSTGDILAMSGRGIRKVNNKYETYDITQGVITNSITPGSVVKGASIMVGYKEGAIKIGETMTDSCIKIFSYPKKCSWKTLGVVNDIKALSLSSNVFQFKTALKVAGVNYYYNKKVTDVSEAFNKYREFFKEIGLGSKTNIDLPIDGIGNVGTNSSPDLYLNYVIGQYDTYTTMQLSEYISTIANKGTRVSPHLLLEVRNNDNSDTLGSVFYKYEPEKTTLNIDKKYISRVREGFREVMTSGLGRNFMGSVPTPAGKTGTSESFYDSNGDGVIDSPTVSNAFVGYYPANNPKMSIAITFPNIMAINGDSEARSYVHKEITRRISNKFYELYG